ncbi:UNVERIFIED_CONTAM: hypothetical protein HDU68_012617 [Siphonaria sp. JEL0065]|nr:hypothetical protein HDU68_012617 [Siphonaria sp. JEL0065]
MATPTNYQLIIGYSDSQCTNISQISYQQGTHIFNAPCPPDAPPCIPSLPGIYVKNTCSSSDISENINSLFPSNTQYVFVDQFSDTNCQDKVSTSAITFGYCSPNPLGFSAQFSTNATGVIGSVYTPMGECIGSPAADIVVDGGCKTLAGAVSFKIAVKSAGLRRR